MLPLGAVPLVVTRSPEHIRDLLGGNATEDFPRPKNVIANIKILFGRAQIALDGEEHHNNKRMLSEWLFSEEHNAMMSGPFAEIMLDFIGRVETDMATDNNVEAYHIAELAAADVSAALSIGRTYKALQLGYCPQLDALKACDKIFLNRAMNKKWKETEPKEITESFERNKKVLADTFVEAFAKIKGGEPVNYNIMSHMVEQNLMHRSEKCPMGEVPTELEAVSNLIGFLAGVGNSARMNTIGIEMMARRQDIQELVLEELHRVLGGLSPAEAKKRAKQGLAVAGARNPNLYTYDKIMQLHYLKCVMYECLRLYTPSTSVAPRACTTSSPLGDYTIPAGTNVMCNIYGAHRHPKYWEDPLKFDPLRFNDAAPGEPIRVKGFVPEGFFPFGYGGHSCIGRALAQFATTMMWAMLIASSRIYKTPGKPNAHFNTLKSDQILGFIEAVNGCHISLEKRKRDIQADEAMDKMADETARMLKVQQQNAVNSLKQGQTEGTTDRNRVISMDEVARHNNRGDGIWFVIDGNVYEMTEEWLKKHPGGADVLIRAGGRDVSTVFKLTNHSSYAVSEAKKYQIGTLQTSISKI
mmetsp:Transcript_41078/g.66129  ORF Transcript_41078/g.66129 Transcript_41078/m.66129 type:complete len:583 (+) Transcript_41078:501-2249(+)